MDYYLFVVKIKGVDKMFKYFKNLVTLSALVFIGIAENSINMMCVLHLDEIELPKELKNKEF